ncbi:YlzJ-like family protein [Sediminibacillus albus]|uniref:YlzJ-like protein n=1 Tax=Sediminibacillus albus TaxID=407036 RepID=A0A1G8W1L0_9BACI|nr:YlzJ-like family protein [Sediminibacillus albus]SDJ71340.1 YlzJ-like protein [Sediminibacillus albus]
MILYTPLSEVDIFGTDPEAFNNRQFMNVHGRLVHAERTAEGTYRILQLMSTDPQDYLDASFTPGSVISN